MPLLPIFLIALLGGCATAHSETDRGEQFSTVVISTVEGEYVVPRYQRNPDYHSLEFPPDRVWQVLPRVYRALEIPVGTHVSSERLIGNTQLRVSRRLADARLSTFIDCGLDPGLQRPAADHAPVQLSVLTGVVPAGEGTELRTRVEGVGFVASGRVGCRSTGALENLITQVARATLAGEG